MSTKKIKLNMEFTVRNSETGKDVYKHIIMHPRMDTIVNAAMRTFTMSLQSHFRRGEGEHEKLDCCGEIIDYEEIK